MTIATALAHLRFWWSRRVTDRLMQRCRVCGSGDDVISFDPRGAWAYFWRRTWCPAHCPCHEYIYGKYEGHYCDRCGQAPPPDWHGYHFD